MSRVRHGVLLSETDADIGARAYYGGSHKAFLDGWSAAGRHQWSILPLPAFKWKWRMRHAAVTFARQIELQLAEGPCPDLLLCSDMLNLAEFLGLAPKPVRDLPRIVYFHENQLTYPSGAKTSVTTSSQ